MSDSVKFSKICERVSSELSALHRAKHYMEWRSENAATLQAELSIIEPFSSYPDVLIFTGDESTVTVSPPPFGEWVTHQLLKKKKPAEILSELDAEITKNKSSYTEVSPIYGVDLDVEVDLGEGIVLVPKPSNQLSSMSNHALLQSASFPEGSAFLQHSYSVEPAFQKSGARKLDPSVTVPAESQRDAVRRRVRLACLLASVGPVELPLTLLRSDSAALFVAGEGNRTERAHGARPKVSFPVKAEAVERAYQYLKGFPETDTLDRAIDRLGRARLALSPIDRALELGIAAEIALMYDNSPTNSEITHKISTRAAWLLGKNPTERIQIMDQVKHLYQARSQAVHSGTLSKKLKVDLDAADQLVGKVLAAIVAREEFPDWKTLTFGGEDAAQL